MTNGDDDKDDENGPRNPSRMWPAIINVINSYAAYNRRENEKPHDPLAHRIGFWTRATALGTIFGALLAGFAAFIFLCQLNEMRAEKVQTATQLRAYVRVGMDESHPPRLDPTTKILRVFLLATNRGLTPALGATHWVSVTVLPYPRTIPLPSPPEGQLHAASIGPGEHITLATTPIGPLTDEQIAGLNAGTQKIYVWGDFRYADEFGGTPRTHFGFIIGPQQGTDPTAVEIDSDQDYFN